MKQQQRAQRQSNPVSPRPSGRALLRDRWWRVSLGVSLVILSGGAVAVWWQLHGVTERIAIHYTTLFGIDRLGSWWLLFAPLLGGAILTTMHVCLMRWRPGLFSVVQWRMVAVTNILLWLAIGAAVALLLVFNRGLFLDPV